MEPDLTPVAQLDYSTRHEQVPRWIMRGFAGAAILYGTLDLVAHAMGMTWWLQNPSALPINSWRNAMGVAITFGHVLAAMALIASAVGLIRSEPWSRMGAFVAAWVIIGMTLTELGMTLLGLQGSMSRGIFYSAMVTANWTAMRLIPAIYPAMLVWFLTRPAVLALFDREKGVDP